MKAASVGIVDQIATRLRQWSLRKGRGGSTSELGSRIIRPSELLGRLSISMRLRPPLKYQVKRVE